jgi:dephospho-CoA kinase
MRCGLISTLSKERITLSAINFQVEPSPDGGFTARALGHSIFTQADTLAELEEMVRYAVQCHFDTGIGPNLIHLQGLKILVNKPTT